MRLLWTVTILSAVAIGLFAAGIQNQNAQTSPAPQPPAIGGAATAQPQSHARLEFDVASIKRDHACGGPQSGGPPPSPGRLSVRCTTLRNLIKMAYVAFAAGIGFNRKNTQVVGGPDWLDSEYYDIDAKAEGKARTEEMAGPMMQSLLENRFKLQLHRETREVPVYLLTVAKGGPKLEHTREGSCIQVDPNHPPLPPAQGQRRPAICGNQTITGNGQTVTISVIGVTVADWVSGAVTRFADRPILNQTGLTGLYDVHLEFAPENAASGPQSRSGADSDAIPAVVSPPFFAAIRQQLGLELNRGRGPVEVFVIDHIERSSED